MIRSGYEASPYCRSDYNMHIFFIVVVSLSFMYTWFEQEAVEISYFRGVLVEGFHYRTI